MGAVGLLAAMAFLVACPLWPLLSDTGTRIEQVLTVVLRTPPLAVAFGWMLWRITKSLPGMGVTVDHNGISPFDGRRTDTINWSEIAGIGFGSYPHAEGGLNTRALPGLEIYFRKTDDAATHPRLHGDWQVVEAPVDGFSARCFRYIVSPSAGKRPSASRRRCAGFHPELWAGPFVHER